MLDRLTQPVQAESLRGLLVIMAFVGVLFPLVGASLLIAFAVDRVLVKLAV
jgi:uncharacterized iron-regulated membrane protein